MNELEELKKDYVAELPSKVDAIQRSTSKIIADLNGNVPPNWKELERLSHKLAGSSGTYGFMHLSLITRQIEDLICDGAIQRAPAEAAANFLEVWSEAFSECVRAVTLGRSENAKTEALIESVKRHATTITERKAA